MNAISLELPDQMTADVDKAVEAGWFADRQDSFQRMVVSLFL